MPTATPIPYDLTVLVADEVGNSVAGAEVSLAEVAAIQTADDAGQTTWLNLAGEAATLAVAAQGYLPSETSVTLERGPNEVTVVLERDPYGRLPSDVCASGETLLYLEDFQDQRAPGWPAIEFQTAGWSFGAPPDEAGNVAARMTSVEHILTSLEGPAGTWVFENSVWRLRFLISGAGRMLSLNWRQLWEPYQTDAGEVGDSRYQIIMGSIDPAAARRIQLPVLNVNVANGGFVAQAEAWHAVEISTFDGRTEVWVDGRSVLGFTDPEPVPPGAIGLELFPAEGDVSAVFFDDLAVCQLSGPFAPGPTPAPTAAP